MENTAPHRVTAILTRPEGRNERLAEALQHKGVATLILPALQVEAMDFFNPQLHHPAHYDAVVFVSSKACECYLQALRAHAIAWPDGVYAASVGAASARSLYQYKVLPAERIIHPPETDPNQDSEALWLLLQQRQLRLARVLIVRGQQGREWLGRRFEEQGVVVERVAVYQRIPAMWSSTQQQQLEEALIDGICVFLLTSSESVWAMMQNIKRLGLTELWVKQRFVAIHERIAERLQSEHQALGLDQAPTLFRSSPSIESMCEAIVHAVSAK